MVWIPEMKTREDAIVSRREPTIYCIFITIHDQMVVVNEKTHRDHVGAMPYLPAALDMAGPLPYDTRNRPVARTVDFGFVIGKTFCVRTGPGDDVHIARRPNRRRPARLVRGREPEDTTLFSFAVVKDARHDSTYLLVTAFPGAMELVPEHERHLPRRERTFWKMHALIDETPWLEERLGQLPEPALPPALSLFYTPKKPVDSMPMGRIHFHRTFRKRASAGCPIPVELNA